VEVPPRSRTRARDAGGALQRALDALAQLATLAPRAMLVVVLATALPAAWLASRLELRTSFLDLLSPHDPEARSLFEVLARTGGLGFSTILVPASDRASAERVVDAMGRELGALPFVRYVDGRRDTAFLEDHALQLAEPAAIEALARDAKAAVDHAIAARAGFRHPETMSVAFTRRNGMPPSRWRLARSASATA
jgi:predicted RND superfamily exporter protein